MPQSFSIRIVFTVLALIGFALVPRLPLRLLPQPQEVSLRVSYTWPQAGPLLIEQEVTAPLEASFSLVQGIDRLYSVSGNGDGYITVDLKKGTDPDLLRFSLSSAVRRIYPQLPEGVSYPLLEVNAADDDDSDQPVLIYSLSGPRDASGLYDFAQRQLLPVFSVTDGLQRVELQGGNRQEWVITFHEQRLQTLDLSSSDLQAALTRHFREGALGNARSQGDQYYVRLAPGQTNWDRIPIANHQGRMIYLGDVASAALREQSARQFFRINGQNSLRLLFYADQRANTIQLAQRIREQSAGLTPNLPADFRLQLEDDRTRFLRDELTKIERRTGLSLLILLLFAAATYRSWRYLTLIVTSLLANLGVAAILYYYLDVQLQLYALAGITVSFGMMIDNTIIMAHHVRTHGNRGVFPALLAATLTTLSALLVIFFLPEGWQYKLADFAKVMMINLGVSLLVALWLVPAIMDGLFSGKGSGRVVAFAKKVPALRRQVRWQRRYQSLLHFLLRFRGWWIAVVILLFGLPVFLLPAKVEGWEWYNRSIGSDTYQEDLRPHVNRWLGGTLRLFYTYVYEGANYRDPEETVLYVRGSMEQGATADQLDRAFQLLEGYLSGFDAQLQQYVTRVYSGQRGQLAIYFQPAYEGSFPYLLKARLESYVSDIGNVTWSVTGVGRGFSTGGGANPPTFRVQMYGYNLDELAAISERFAERLQVNPRVRNVDTEANFSWFARDLYAFDLELDRRQLARYALSPGEPIEVLRRFNQAEYPDLTTPDGTPVRLVGDQQRGRDRFQLQTRQFAANSGAALQLQSLGDITRNKISSAIHKENQQYLRVLAFEYTGSGRFGSRHLDATLDATRPELPLGYAMERNTYSYGGEEKRTYGLVLPLILLIYLICAIVFESLRQALAIVLLIPISFIGIFLVFYHVPGSFDQGGYTAFLLVSGLAVNSLILVINDFNGLRRAQPGRSLRTLYVRALGQKLTPILLSVLSTICGLIPFLLDGKDETFWFALALGAIGGLVCSVLVLLFFVPVAVLRRGARSSSGR